MPDYLFYPALGGFLIGLSASLLMLVLGRIAGISGMISGVISGNGRTRTWQVVFLAGLAASPLLHEVVFDRSILFIPTESLTLMSAGGLLVGLGTTLGSGCTSGHGVCGVARLSPRSLAATATFMVTAMLTLYISRHVLGIN